MTVSSLRLPRRKQTNFCLFFIIINLSRKNHMLFFGTCIYPAFAGKTGGFRRVSHVIINSDICQYRKRGVSDE